MDLFDGHLVLFVQKGDLSMFCSIDLPIDIDPEVSILNHLTIHFFP